MLIDEYKNAMNTIAKYIKKESSYGVICSQEQVQCDVQDYSILFGLHSLRLVVVNNNNNTAYTFVPTDVVYKDKVLHSFGCTVNVFNTSDTVQKEFGTLTVDGGELFQLSTLYDCDFSDTSDFLPKFLEVLLALKTSSLKYNNTIIDQAIQNLKEAISSEG